MSMLMCIALVTRRYDKLVGLFTSKDIPAVGVSIGIERVFNIMEERLRAQAAEINGMIRETETQVLVASIGNGLQGKRMAIAAQLWQAGIKVWWIRDTRLINHMC